MQDSGELPGGPWKGSVTMKLGLLGRVLGHSLSPEIHTKIFQALGISGTYDLVELEPEQVGPFLTQETPAYNGCNVTIPYKERVLPYLTEISPEAEKIGASNTLFFTDGGVKGYNTDYHGFDQMLQAYDIPLAGKNVTVLGNGGAAKAVLQVVADRKAAQITILVRSREKAQNSLSRFLKAQPETQLKLYTELEDLPGGDVIINTTPIGMYPKTGVSPVPASFVGKFGAAVDIIYNPAVTQFLADAAAAGAKTCNGLHMLVGQAVAAEEIWLQKKLPAELVPQIVKQLEENFK